MKISFETKLYCQRYSNTNGCCEPKKKNNCTYDDFFIVYISYYKYFVHFFMDIYF